MNNNINRNNSNNNNNRRRGRSNTNRPQGGGGGQQLNRVDSRARGNAPQLLEKYRKLAHDAHLNGDRVQAEYYLQFADHYFRVLADQRLRQDEQQRGRRDEGYERGSEESQDDSGEFNVESDFPSFDQQPNYNNRPREDRPREDRPRAPRQDLRDRFEPSESVLRQAQDERVDEGGNDNGNADENEATAAPQTRYEPPENPFVRENTGTRGLRPRRALREPQDDRGRPRREEQDDDAPVGLDPSILPPPIALSPIDLAADDEPPAPKRPRGRPRKVVDAAPVEQD